MTLDALLSELSRLGLAVALSASGTPVLRGPREAATAEILESLRAHREAVLARLRPAPFAEAEVLMKSGRVKCSTLYCTILPFGATAWRWAGEQAWRPVDLWRPGLAVGEPRGEAKE